MQIEKVDIKNFRKLQNCSISFADKTTLFVGANNSGKTSAMDAMAKFLNKRKFVFNDITLSNRIQINEIGARWLEDENTMKDDISSWNSIMPQFDMWIAVIDNELQYVADLLPTLEWTEGRIGVRFHYCPKDPGDLKEKYVKAYKRARSVEEESKKGLTLWPKNLCDFLEKNYFQGEFITRAYILDPSKFEIEQETDLELECEGNNPLHGIIKVDIINAQRGFQDPENQNNEAETVKGNLSAQLRSYYDKHLNPENMPSLEDLDSLEAINEAERAFNSTLKEKFSSAISELESMGYPGVSDPQISIQTHVSAMESLKHESAVEYILPGENADFRLPERYNGLGYQNLVSMVFLLMRYRDDWMKTGKSAISNSGDAKNIEPIHLVLLEEPEAHLHVQVQQVFIKKAYDVLRNHEILHDNKEFTTQLVITTHSSSIAREVNFANLRYFKRIGCNETSIIPTSKVVDLSDVFGEKVDTDKFVTRYIQTTHCDLFFADAAILVEGAAEKMLIPHFIRNKYQKLNQRYISILEINGRHSHRLKALLEKLCIPVLVITDLDVGEPEGHHKHACPERKKNLISTNYAIANWIIGINDFDKLIDLEEEKKVKKFHTPYSFPIRIAYQKPKLIDYFGKEDEMLSSTFEDSLIYSNLDLFGNTEADEESLIGKIQEKIKGADSSIKLQKEVDETLRNNDGKKASFALDLIFSIDADKLVVPNYIDDGLKWLLTETENVEVD